MLNSLKQTKLLRFPFSPLFATVFPIQNLFGNKMVFCKNQLVNLRRYTKLFLLLNRLSFSFSITLSIRTCSTHNEQTVVYLYNLIVPLPLILLFLQFFSLLFIPDKKDIKFENRLFCSDSFHMSHCCVYLSIYPILRNLNNKMKVKKKKWRRKKKKTLTQCLIGAEFHF